MLNVLRSSVDACFQHAFGADREVQRPTGENGFNGFQARIQLPIAPPNEIKSHAKTESLRANREGEEKHRRVRKPIQPGTIAEPVRGASWSPDTAANLPSPRTFEQSRSEQRQICEQTFPIDPCLVIAPGRDRSAQLCPVARRAGPL